MTNRILILSALLATAAQAQASRTGAQFLAIDTDARFSGMASAGMASVRGISSLPYNPAGLSAVSCPELAFSHSKWLMDSNHDHIGFAVPLKGAAIGVGVTRLSNGTIGGRADDGSAAADYSAYDQAVSLGAAYRGFGAAVKYIQSSIAGVRAETFAVDLGVRHKVGRLPAVFGVSVQNLGAGLKYMSQRDTLPLSIGAGLSVMVVPGIGLSLDAKRFIHDRRNVLSVGTEYSMSGANGMGLALRGGYGLSGLSAGDESGGLSFGGGVSALGAQVDYSVSPEAGLGSVQRITLKKKF